MDCVNKIIPELEKLMKLNEYLLTKNNVIDIQQYEQREILIEKLTAAKDVLDVALSAITASQDKLSERHKLDQNKMSSLLKNKTAWTVVKSKTTKPAPVKSQISITDNTTLEAIVVTTFEHVQQDGELYYVSDADHFACKISGHLLHGNIGKIYIDDRSPEKIRDCKFAANCMKQDKCDYYHDPCHFPGSKDHRNFIASSFLYANPDSHYKNRSRSRRIGSIEYLDLDLATIQDEEVARFYDQCAHDILLALILKNRVVKFT